MKYRKESKTITRIFFVVFFSLILLLQFSDNWVSGINVYSNQKIDFNLTSTIGIQITEVNIASYSSSGTGAPGDPYIIEDMMIDTTDSLALEFYYVTSYFILRDSSLKGTTYGVILNGVASGVSQVINCIIEGAFSIGGLNSHYMTIHNCTLRSTQGSSFTRGLNFTKNVVEIAGPFSGSIMTVRDEDNIITGNTIYGEASAVKLSHITNSLIVNNGLYGAGFYMYEDSIVNILSNTFSENYVNGKQYGFFYNRSDELISSSDYGQVYLVNSFNVDIEDYVMDNIYVGIQVHNCTDISIRNANITGRYAVEARTVEGLLVEDCNWNGDDDGTQLYYVNDAIIRNNYLSNFRIGVFCESSDNIQLHNNTMFNITETGFYTEIVDNVNATFNIISCFVIIDGIQLAVELNDCENATFYYNIFICLGDLMAHPVEEWSVTNTIWYNEALEIGNHYSDWNGLGTYSIEGDAGSVDLYPFIDFDEDNLIEYQEVIIYFTDPFNADSDNDGLDDDEEINTYGTDPNDEDTDGDGYNDGDEVVEGFDPLNSSSHPSASIDQPAFWLVVGLAAGFGAAILAVSIFWTVKSKKKGK